MNTDRKLTLLGHVRELRTRLLRCVIALIITTALSFIFARQIFGILTLPTGNVEFVFIEMTEMVGTYMKVSLFAGVLLASPYIIYQFVSFVLPALTPREKRMVSWVLPWVGLMFIGGVIFGYFVLIPPAVKFLFAFGSDIATPQIRIGNYISLITRLLLAIGLVFELPVVTTFLARVGVVSSHWLASKRKIALILAFVLGAVITPTFDPINQSLVAVPLFVLYEMSIWLAWLVQKRKRQAEETAEVV